MNTDAVRLFVLAAEKLNISAAGRELGMAPAVASSKLSKLEISLGADLLHRSTRRVSLSTEGAEFLPFAKEILAQEAAARAALGLEQGIVSGTLRFAASSTFAQLYIIPLMPEFLTRYPKIELDLRLSDTRFDLIEGSFDLALRNQSLANSSLKARKLADDMRVLCASPEYLQRHGTPNSLAELNQHQLIGFQGRFPDQYLDQDGERSVFEIAEHAMRMSVDDGLSQKLATLAGTGISNNSLWSVASELQDGRLVRILPELEVEHASSLWLVYPKANVLTAKVRVFIDFLVEQIGSNPIWEQSTQA